MKENEQMLDALRACIEGANMAFGIADEPMATGSAYRCAALIRQHGPALEQSLRSLADENRALLRERDALRKSVEGLLEHAVIFSRSYLAVFNDWPDDKTLQGCETGRWRKAADAADFARATLAGPKP